MYIYKLCSYLNSHSAPPGTAYKQTTYDCNPISNDCNANQWNCENYKGNCNWYNTCPTNSYFEPGGSDPCMRARYTSKGTCESTAPFYVQGTCRPADPAQPPMKCHLNTEYVVIKASENDDVRRLLGDIRDVLAEVRETLSLIINEFSYVPWMAMGPQHNPANFHLVGNVSQMGFVSNFGGQTVAPASRRIAKARSRSRYRANGSNLSRVMAG